MKKGGRQGAEIAIFEGAGQLKIVRTVPFGVVQGERGDCRILSPVDCLVVTGSVSAA